MKINPRRFPTIIIFTFLLLLLIALLLGFRPMHGGGQSSAVTISLMLSLLSGGIL